MVKAMLLGACAIVAAAPVAKTQIFDRLRAEADRAWSAYNITKLGHATLIYAADNDDILPFAPGNFAYSAAINKGATCAAIGPEFKAGCSPANALLIGYGATWSTFQSPADNRFELSGPKTWFLATATPKFLGSSFDYFWHPTFCTKPVNEFQDARQQPLFVSMFTVAAESGSQHQVVYMDGHIGDRSRSSLENQPAPN